ncbi:HemK2/MTQ2 family protein methyltransferase [Archaeoglobus neptunius]|uniref:HemK2/MTQ2 family protein methyltransferase n=1 Tax=Archaeoglobus neptunius TaxID=2798580 RepID=UPI0019258C09|nr:HemK2/MTQ2 family protein methyltransferase [Archaeoglobus neptunius]
MIYDPAEDSELLLETALKEIRPEDEVIEIGAGSGFVAERLKDRCRWIVVTDISPFAVEVLNRKGLDVIRTDIARGIRKKFSLVLFNPPYLELEDELKRGDWLDVAVDGGKGGLEVTSRFLDSLNEIMSDEGRAILIVSSYNEPSIYELIEKRGFKYGIIGERKLFFEKLYAIKIWKSGTSYAD